MPLIPFIAQAVAWLFRVVIIKFVLMAAVWLLVVEFMPFVFELIGVFIDVSSLSTAFSGIPPGVWFFLDFFALNVGLPLMISAHVSRFLIRRIPGIG
jgi:hypothetical protein